MAWFDNGLITETCEDLEACDSAVELDTAVENENSDDTAQDTADTGEELLPFTPNRYHARFIARISDGSVVSQSDWLPRIEFLVFDQTEDAVFQAHLACKFTLTSTLWNNVMVFSGTFAGFQPTSPQWTQSGRCDEMNPDTLQSLQLTFEQSVYRVALGPLTPETLPLLTSRQIEILHEQLAVFYLQIVDGPSDLLISPGVVSAWSDDGSNAPDFTQPLILDGVVSPPSGFYESLSLTHHALP